MKKNYPLRQTAKVLFYIGLVLIFLLPRCKTGDLKEQVAILAEKQAFLAGERDSLQRLLDIKTREVDTVYKNYNALSANVKTLTTKNKSLQSGYYSRDEQLKNVTQDNAEISSSVAKQSSKNDSLQAELRYLQEKIAATDKAVAAAQRNYATLEQTVKQQEAKIIADSIVKAQTPVVVKETGFQYTGEIGGGFGLGDVSVDYSRRLVSFNAIAAYRINNHFRLGIGTGVHAYNGGAMIPLYADMRYTFKDAMLSPFLVADGGVLFTLKNFSSSGLFINPAVGLKKKLTERVSVNLSAGVLIQEPPAGMRSTFINFKGGVSFRGK